ncbi:SAVED domain-containing protein [Clostridium tagluense]|uniref:SAVED domain-containing protein n=1 Tax=Clostridium tagluense TaxID=360422 RepID=UPI001CF56B0D|nr:SAVED domain-containing protein [Clostridium tagluense]MCB2312916.1 SAVED domain-containing protein [Clostridium tagluense]MCB2317682.1 SAVED domain-containing protein [Clostridium tagluense]MCB2322484.1 SAVED domain-containing protein [Clostridium tagluense]MCB2327486.1 SAVED domain-containing protein [Clostridium tagluense]MCB2332205.1 SAVED domain-containing protein [Clostridium tagluense]
MINWDGINKFSCVVTIGTPIVTFFLGMKFSKFKRWIDFKKIRKNVSQNSGVLIISIGKNDIENQVKFWLCQRKGYKDIPNDKIIAVEKLGEINSKHISSLIEEIENKKTKLQRKGVDKIHLFIAAPVSIAAMIGANLSNNNAFVYQHNFNGKSKYELWGRLKRLS